MSDALTLDVLSVPLRALRSLAAEFGHLPAPVVYVHPVDPNRVDLNLHGSLADFEIWREALDIAPDAVEHHIQSTGRTRVLRASGTYAGAEVELVGYTQVDLAAVSADVGEAA